MSLVKVLLAEAELLNETSHAEIGRLKGQLAEAEAHVRKLKDKLERLDKFPDRMKAYAPEKSADPDCPHCWLESGLHAPVKPIVGGGHEEEHYRCTRCHFEYVNRDP